MYNPTYISLFSKVLRRTVDELNQYPPQVISARDTLLDELTAIPENQQSLARSVFDSWSGERGHNSEKIGFVLKLAILIDVNIIQSDIEINELPTNESNDWDGDKLVTTDLLLAITEKMVVNSLRIDLPWAEETIQKNLTSVIIEYRSFVSNSEVKRIIQNCLVQLNDALNLEEAFNLVLWLNKEAKSHGIHDTEELFTKSCDRRWNPANLNVNRLIMINILMSNTVNCIQDNTDESTDSLVLKAEKIGQDRWSRLAIRCLSLLGNKIKGGLDPRRIIYCILNENRIENNYNFYIALDYLEHHSKVLDGTKKFKNEDVINFSKFLDLIKA
jgi:hypothetical protein